jgi:hypothetical protein
MYSWGGKRNGKEINIEMKMEMEMKGWEGR